MQHTVRGKRQYTLYSTHMSPENTRKLMRFYMEVLILGVILWYMVSASLMFPVGCIRLILDVVHGF